MADRICCYGNCENEFVAVTVNIKSTTPERLVYCCLEHAAADLTKQVNRRAALRLPSEKCEAGS